MSESRAVWMRTPEEVLSDLDVTLKRGLSETEAKKRLRIHGPNRLKKATTRSTWKILIEQFKSIIIGILAVAAVLSFVMAEWVEGIAVTMAIVINTAIGFFSELRAVRSMEALQKLSRTSARVKREGSEKSIASENLIPGDILILEAGDVVSADCRIIQASKLQVNESTLTGESVASSKTADILDREDKPLAERKNMLYKGTALTRGSATGVVVATGMGTELGHISKLAQEAGMQQQTPLERHLQQLGQWLVWLTLAVAFLVAVAGIVAGRDLRRMIEIAVALAVAAVPEGLPIVATVALARGMWRMARRNALIRNLSAVETLGATSVICTDKTGTLTENQMTLRRLQLHSGDYNISGEGLSTDGEITRNGNRADPLEDDVLKRSIEIGLLCNDALLDSQAGEKASGDAMEVALLVAGAKAGISRSELQSRQRRVREEAFDPEIKMMATFHATENHRFRVAVKGAPSAVLENCSLLGTGDEMTAQKRRLWEQRADDLAGEGLRVLALAEKFIEDKESNPYESLTLLGVIGFLDPPRSSVRAAIRECQEAGIRVVMVTGDQAITAKNVGIAVGLKDAENALVMEGNAIKTPEELSPEEQKAIINASILSRVSPEQKLNLIDLHRRHKSVVAMTGDGVNDAPALEKADIGIAMGGRGTEVARPAADMILKDDAFPTIVAAVEQGRAIFNNIRAFTIYLLSGNMGEILAVGLASILGLPIPLLPIQILYINVVNDIFPALALGMGHGAENLMQKPPRRSQESILTDKNWIAITGYGIVIGAILSISYFLAAEWLGFDRDLSLTVSFITLGFARLWHVFNMRQSDSGILFNEITKNRYVWAALLLCAGLLLMAVYLPGLSDALRTRNPGISGWLLILVMSLMPFFVGQISKLVAARKVL
ncbi:MAG: cation-translocating P-type ATPase [Fibrobacterota bacterium]